MIIGGLTVRLLELGRETVHHRYALIRIGASGVRDDDRVSDSVAARYRRQVVGFCDREIGTEGDSTNLVRRRFGKDETLQLWRARLMLTVPSALKSPRRNPTTAARGAAKTDSGTRFSGVRAAVSPRARKNSAGAPL